MSELPCAGFPAPAGERRHGRDRTPRRRCGRYVTPACPRSVFRRASVGTLSPALSMLASTISRRSLASSSAIRPPFVRASEPPPRPRPGAALAGASSSDPIMMMPAPPPDSASLTDWIDASSTSPPFLPGAVSVFCCGSFELTIWPALSFGGCEAFAASAMSSETFCSASRTSGATAGLSAALRARSATAFMSSAGSVDRLPAAGAMARASSFNLPASRSAFRRAIRLLSSAAVAGAAPGGRVPFSAAARSASSCF